MDEQQQADFPDSPAHDAAPFPVVGIGASAGGLRALTRLLENMPPAPGMALVVVLQLPQDHPGAADTLLQRATAMPVVQVRHRTRLMPDQVYLILPGQGLRMEDGELLVDEPQAGPGIALDVDMFFRTLAEAHGEAAIGVILSGTGSGGVAGLASIKEHGGVTIAQLPGEAEESGMPQSAVDSGMVDFVLPAAQVPARLLEMRDVMAMIRRHALPVHRPLDAAPFAMEAQVQETLDDILALLCARTGHDFRHYKQPTVLRCLTRRLRVRGVPDLAAYYQLLQGELHEAQSLLQDLLIGVTNFFRDRDAFNVLEQAILPRIFHGKEGGAPLMAWVTACSTGEEAYSLGMLLAEHAEQIAGGPAMQIFATDVDERAIAVARAGRYPDAIAADVPATRLARYFMLEGEHFRVRSLLRDRILFAQHDLLHDPAFSNLDLITCRNVLVYLNREIQRHVLEIFHCALNPGGYLFLGGAESADLAPDLFVAVNTRHRLYQAKPSAKIARRLSIRAPDKRMGRPQAERSGAIAPGPAARVSPVAEIHQRMLARLAPPSLLLNAKAEVVHASAEAAAFLRYCGGEPSVQVLSLVLPELRAGLRSALFQAQKTGRPASSGPLRCGDAGAERVLTLSVLPPQDDGTGDGLMLVQFEVAGDAPPRQARAAGAAFDPRVQELEDALREARETLQQTVEQAELSSAGMARTIDTLQATVEGLRTTIDDLEVNCEELQSRNEELYTVSAELQVRVEETSQANDDLSNLIASTDIATLFLDRGMRIQRYTPHVTRIYNIIDADVGRPLAHLTHKLGPARLTDSVASVLMTSQPAEQEARSTDGRDYIVRVHPYRTAYDRVEGVVITFFDISRRRSAEDALRESEARFRALAEASPALIWQVDCQGNAVYVNQRYLDVTGIALDALRGTGWHAVVHPDDAAAYVAAARRALAEEAMFQHRVRLRMADGSYHWFESHGHPWCAADQQFRGLVGISIDVNEAVQAEEALRSADRRKDAFLATLAHELRNPLAPISNALQLLGDPEGRRHLDRSLDIVQRQVRQMVRLVDDLMEVTRISRGKVDLRRAPVALAEVLGSAVETSQPALEQKRQQLTVTLEDDTLMLDADKARLTQVFANLLNNAARYTAAGGRIWLSARTDGHEALVTVRDTGMGIREDQLPAIFEMFSQPHGRDGHSDSGLGIGLAMVRSLVELHGGTVQAHSAGIGKGSEFVVHLPLHAVPGVAAPAVEAAGDENGALLAGQRILVVDDNRDAADSLCQLLASRGADARALYDGRSAIDALEASAPHAIVLDIGMPEMDGYQVAQQIRQDKGTEGVRIVALTGWGQHADRVRSRACGFDHHLTKPAQLQALLKILAS